jgi:hypothetical protein
MIVKPDEWYPGGKINADFAMSHIIIELPILRHRGGASPSLFSRPNRPYAGR